MMLTLGTVERGNTPLAASHDRGGLSLDGSWHHQRATTRASSSTPAWKHEVAKQIGPIDPDVDGPIELHVGYRLSSGRTVDDTIGWQIEIDIWACRPNEC